MAVYPPDDPSPPPPPGVAGGLGITRPTETDPAERDATDQEQPATQDGKDEKETRLSRCLRWLFHKNDAQRKRPKTKRSTMGRFGGLFKKSDKSKVDENPYAQQPVAQSAPPPQYGQYNQSQYNDNRYVTQPSQGPPSGLPSGPRPGGLPSRVAPGPTRNDTWESNKTSGPPPPRYSDQPANSPPPPSYHGSPAHGRSPAPSSTTASSATGNGFPREKYGAQDGFGRNRFEPAAPSPYDRSQASASQRPGGYGGLDSESGGLFDNYKPPRQQPTDPSLAQAGPSPAFPEPYGDPQHMTEEEEVEWTKAQIVEGKMATNDVARRNLGRLASANQQMDAMNSQLRREWEILKNAEKNIDASSGQAKIGGVNIDDLDAANTTIFNLAANSKSRIQQRAEKKLAIRQHHERLQDETKREADEIDREWEAERQRFQSSKPKGLLGGPAQKTDASRFQFEDDTGEQQVLDDEYDDLVENMGRETRKLREQAQFQGFMLEKQNRLLDTLSDKAQNANDTVAKNQLRLDVRYGKH